MTTQKENEIKEDEIPDTMKEAVLQGISINKTLDVLSGRVIVKEDDGEI